jgi:site-specific DNA-methyltransferase (adenine-specific)
MKGDCLELMKNIPDGSVDMILCDLPYGTTSCKWDTVIPFEPLWEQYRRIIKKNGAIVLFGSQPFTSALVMSNPTWFKYDWYWEKDKATGHLNAKKQPMRNVETISVFYGKQCMYNPQLYVKDPRDIRPATNKRMNSDVYGDMSANSVREIPKEMGYPKQILKYSSQFGGGIPSHHPTQKPVALCEYLIRTYTNEGETVMDNTMGSGTTGVACANTRRNFIGIEQDDKYFEIGKNRIEEANK